MLRLLPRWLLPALAAVLFGGCASSPGPTRNPTAAPAGGNDAMSMPAPPPADLAAPWSFPVASLPRLFSHRVMVPPLQLTQIDLGAKTPTLQAAMRRFAEAAPAALAQRGLFDAHSYQEPNEGWLTLIASSQGVDWVFGVQFTVDGGGRTLTLRLRTAGAANIGNPQAKKMDQHIGTLVTLVPALFAD
ncbi:hypothetical protein [Achromobacter xylosoxidans]|uniref:hypothetical protein n=1 Tax=Alcaligenes xylosoxydans xylosoxydans TaxID=85698 RepID=UPI00292F109F|nr:hypothetical protein [Achromobacter xylosoxidans]WOB71150.1 hypothetical protein PZA07_17825 [Achromobacter xylosoxidans]